MQMAQSAATVDKTQAEAHRAHAAAAKDEAAVQMMPAQAEAHQAEDVLRQGQADLIAMARELMYNPNWPVHAARTLGVPDYLRLLPRDYAWWLERREKIREITPVGADGPAPGENAAR